MHRGWSQMRGDLNLSAEAKNAPVQQIRANFFVF